MINKFAGEEIYFMKELLIPYKGWVPDKVNTDSRSAEEIEAQRRA